MGKNIVICLDGTDNKFGKTNTNVVKLNSMLDKDRSRQIRFYQNGLGTMGEVDWMSIPSKIYNEIRMRLEGAFGFGIYSNLKEAYSFLMDNYEPGDKVYVFGFSRGAYTAKALCALLHQFGLLEKGQYHLIDHIFTIAKNPTKNNLELSRRFKKDFSIECKPHFLGIWDAVSSVGMIYNPMMIRYTFDNPDIRYIRHAIAIDEKRAFFPPHLCSTDNKGQDSKEVYFAGVHSDVGGGYPEEESQLSKFALEWMIQEAELAGILVDPKRKARVLGPNENYVEANATASQHTSLTLKWWIAEFIAKKVWNPEKKKLTWRMNLFRRRSIPNKAIIHPSVELRMKSGVGYSPTNLPKDYITWDASLHSIKSEIVEASKSIHKNESINPL